MLDSIIFDQMKLLSYLPPVVVISMALLISYFFIQIFLINSNIWFSVYGGTPCLSICLTISSGTQDIPLGWSKLPESTG